MAPFRRRFLAAGLAAALLPTLSCVPGCAKSPALRPAAQAATPVPSADTFESGSYAEVTGDYARLKADVPRTIKKVHWGLLSLDAPDAKPSPADSRPPVRAEALAPDGRSVMIVVWPLGGKRLGVAVRGGRFGSRQLESLFVNKLQSVLAGKPMPKRGGTFILPD
jgi:hypothetical protein